MQRLRAKGSGGGRVITLAALVFASIWGPHTSAGQSTGPEVRTVTDAVGDGARRSLLNLGTNGPAAGGSNLPLPDMAFYRIGPWRPLDGANDLFRGAWTNMGQFVRLDMAFDGLVNPPGTLGCCGNPFDPFLYGPRPLYGFIEIDMDADIATGGELDSPNLFYLGNLARFGGLSPIPRLAGRVAMDHRAFDGDITTPPFVDRSGEEFHVSLDGQGIFAIENPDDTDAVFGPGETWVLVGTLFHRASGYERFSNACCSGAPGSYNPVVRMQFSHSAETNRTLVSLVYPLTNAAAAAGDPSELPDNDPENQNSVHEALHELVLSAQFASSDDRADPDFAIIEGWATKIAADYLNPLDWEVTVLVGGCYYEPASGDTMLAWSDVHPNVLPGDFNGDGSVTGGDVFLINAFIDQHDGWPAMDADGTVNGEVVLVNFIPNFSVFDLNYDGRINPQDRPNLFDFGDYDGDGDGDVDLRDFAMLQRCVRPAPTGPLAQVCQPFDGNADGHLDGADVEGFVGAMTGPE